jgi:hypothetical protein
MKHLFFYRPRSKLQNLSRHKMKPLSNDRGSCETALSSGEKMFLPAWLAFHYSVLLVTQKYNWNKGGTIPQMG